MKSQNVKYEHIANKLISLGNKLLSEERKHKDFCDIHVANILLNDFDNYPHHFVLACTMDRQINAKKAWEIPYKIGKEIGGQTFKEFINLTEKSIKKIFSSNKLHRYNDKMSIVFYKAIKKIHDDYNGNAKKIWNDNPSSGTLVRRFLEFNGIGVKIATMATNVLVRDFKIKIKDKRCIDISPDIQVKKVFKRIGFVRGDAKNNEEYIYCARELYPEYPGVFDFHTWDIGQSVCRDKKPICEVCILNKLCPKLIYLDRKYSE